MRDFYERLLERVKKSSGEIVKIDDGTIKIWLVEEDSAELLADIENPIEAHMLFKFLVIMSPKTQSLLEEAHLISRLHPSKDARAFAKNVTRVLA